MENLTPSWEKKYLHLCPLNDEMYKILELLQKRSIIERREEVKLKIRI